MNLTQCHKILCFFRASLSQQYNFRIHLIPEAMLTSVKQIIITKLKYFNQETSKVFQHCVFRMMFHFWLVAILKMSTRRFLCLKIQTYLFHSWGIKGCGSKSVYFQILAILLKYTDLLPHPLYCCDF